MDKDLTDMTKKNSERNSSKIYCNKINKVAVAQCHDNKVDTVVSTLGVAGRTPVYRWKGSDIL